MIYRYTRCLLLACREALFGQTGCTANSTKCSFRYDQTVFRHSNHCLFVVIHFCIVFLYMSKSIKLTQSHNTQHSAYWLSLSNHTTISQMALERRSLCSCVLECMNSVCINMQFSQPKPSPSIKKTHVLGALFVLHGRLDSRKECLWSRPKARVSQLSDAVRTRALDHCFFCENRRLLGFLLRYSLHLESLEGLLLHQDVQHVMYFSLAEADDHVSMDLCFRNAWLSNHQIHNGLLTPVQHQLSDVTVDIDP